MATDAVMPPPPPGFVLDSGAPPPPPPGFVLEGSGGEPPAAPKPSWYETLGRQPGLAVRGAVGGLAGLADMVPAAVNPIINRVTGANLSPTPVSNLANRGMDALGLPQPQNATERIVGAGVGGMAGGLGMAGAAAKVAQTASTPLAKAVAGMLAQAPAMQGAAGATGGMAGAGARELGAGPGVQTLASLIGGVAPSVPALAGAGARAALRGSDANLPAMAERVADFRAAGSTQPSLGQISGNRLAQATESVLAKTPGGAGPRAAAAEKQATEIGAKAESVADSLSSIATPTEAGRAIERGISGEGGFISRFKAGQKALYDKIDTFIPQQRAVDVTRTKQALADMNADIPNAPALSQWFKNAKMQGIEAALGQDTAGNPKQLTVFPGVPGVAIKPPTNQLPYEAVKKLRSLVGAELENPSLASDVPRSKWKALYASLSQDLEGMAKATGNPDAIKAMARANRFSRAGHERIDTVLEGVTKAGTAERIFRDATSAGDLKVGATKIAGVLKSMEPAERDVVKSAFIRRMGLATAGNQNAAGDRFSPATFLTNWNRVSPAAKAVLFSSEDGSVRRSLDAIAKSAEYIKDSGKVFANASGTAPALASYSAATTAIGSLLTGHPVAAGLVGAGVAGANLSAKLMSNPAFLKWMEKSVNLPPAAVPAALATLAKAAENQPDDVRNDMDAYAQALTQQIAAQPDQARSIADQMAGAKK